MRISTLVVVAGLAVSGSTARAQLSSVTINPDGGTSTEDGLRIDVFEDATIQIYREDQEQLYTNEGFSLAVGEVGYTPIEWETETPLTPVSQSAVTGSGAAGSPWQVVTVVEAATGYQMAVTVRYVLGDSYLRLRAVVTPPGANDQALKLYWYADTYLSGGDNGAAFWLPEDAPPETVPTVVGVNKDVDGTTQYEVMVVGNRTWDHYYSADYDPPYGTISAAQDLDDSLDTNVETDNGIGAEWLLGAATTPQDIQFLLSFSAVNELPTCGDGATTGFETCDDGGVAGEDGCSALCQIEDGYTCSGEPSVCELASTPSSGNGDGCSCGSGGASVSLGLFLAALAPHLRRRRRADA